MSKPPKQSLDELREEEAKKLVSLYMAEAIDIIADRSIPTALLVERVYAVFTKFADKIQNAGLSEKAKTRQLGRLWKAHNAAAMIWAYDSPLRPPSHSEP